MKTGLPSKKAVRKFPVGTEHRGSSLLSFRNRAIPGLKRVSGLSPEPLSQEHTLKKSYKEVLHE